MASWTSWRFFMSALSDSTTCFGLNVEGAVAAAGTPVVLWPWQGGAQNELWRIDTDGRIISALGDGQSLVLGLGGTYNWGPNGNYIVLCNIDPTDATQLWSFGANGMIANRANPSMVLNVDGGVGVNDAAIITYPVQDGTPLDEIWWPAPIVPVKQSPNWMFVQSGLTDSVNTYGLSMQAAGATKEAILAPYAPGQDAQAWVIGDGVIVSKASYDLPIGLGLGAPVLGHAGSTSVLVDPVLPPVPAAQQWTIDGGTITNVKNGHVLTASLPDSPVVTAPSGSESAAAQSWTALPINPLASILTQAPEPFPVFTGDQATAYASINQQLGLTGTTLRDQYVVLNPAALANDAGQLPGLTCPSNVSASDWSAVIEQLTAELNGAIAVQGLFIDYASFHDQMFTQQVSLVDQLIGDAQIDTGTNITGAMFSVFESVAYLGMSEVPDGGSVVANLMSVGLAIAGGVASSTPVANSFQVACSDLWNELNTNFAALADAITNGAYVILSDWGRLRAMAPLTTSTQVGGLGWTITDDLVSSLLPAFTASVMQMLMPAKYMLWYQEVPNNQPVSDVPSYDQWITPSLGGMWYATWITEISDDDKSPGQAPMNDIFGPQMNGYVKQSDFWLGKNGWNFQIQSAWEG